MWTRGRIVVDTYVFNYVPGFDDIELTSAAVYIDAAMPTSSSWHLIRVVFTWGYTASIDRLSLSALIVCNLTSS